MTALSDLTPIIPTVGTGTTGPKGDPGNPGAPGASSALFRYNYNANMVAPPLSAQVRANGANAALSTLIWVHRLDFNGVDERVQLLMGKSGDRVFVQDMQDSTSFAVYRLTADAVDNTSYVTFAVTLEQAGPTPLTGAGILIGVTRQGPAGPAGPGVPTGGSTDQVLAKGSATDFDTIWKTSTAGGGGIDPGVLIDNSILKADIAGAPSPLTVPPSTFVGRGATGGISALTSAQAKTALAIASGDVSGLGALATKSGVGSADITDGSIVAVDLSATANIAMSQLATNPLARANHTGTQLAATISDLASAVGAIGVADGSITSAKIGDGTIVSADLSPTAGITMAQLAINPLARANHTGTQLAATISDFTTAVQAVPGVGLADGSVTSAKIADGAIVDADIAANAGIALSKLAVDPRDRATHTGVQLAATVSDFHTAVRTNRLDQMAKPTATVDFNGQVGTGLAAPVNAGDVVNKAYADNVAAGLDFKASVRAASTAGVTLASPGATIDGVTLTSGDRVLLKNQATSTENGIYNWNGAASAMTRASDADASAEVTSGMYVFVEGGTANGAKAFVLLTPDPITLGSTGLTFGLFSGGGASIVGTANRVTVTGTQVDIASNYIGQSSLTTVGLVTTGSWIGTTAPATNCVVGYDAGTGLTSGTNNAFAGYQAGKNSGSSAWNTCLGSQTAGAGNFLNGGFNTCVGGQAGYGLNNGANNVFLGYQAGKASVDAGQNIYIGHSAGLNATSSNNVFIGLSAGAGVTSAVGNTLIGNNTGRFLGATPSGDNNTLIGSNVGGSYYYDNTMIGAGAGTNNVNGYANTFVGRSAGATANAGLACVCVGWGADVTGTVGYATVVGRLATSANASGGTAIGNGAQANGNYASALGFGAQANAAGAVAIGANSVGTGAQTAVANEILLGTTAHTVNIPGALKVGGSTITGGPGLTGSTVVTNTYLGLEAGANPPGGFYNTLIGWQAGKAVTNQLNTMVGSQAGLLVTTGIYNTLIGGLAGGTGNPNYLTCLGYRAGYGSSGSSSTDGVFIGANAGPDSYGANNTIIGSKAGGNVNSGASNTIIGYNAATTSLGNGSYNTLIGMNVTTAGVSTASSVAIGAAARGADNAIAIGYNASTTGTNAIAIGASVTAAADQIVIGGASHATYIAGTLFVGGQPVTGGGGVADGSITSAKIADGAIMNVDINASAAIAMSKLATNPLARANHTGTQLATTISDFDTQVRTSPLNLMAVPIGAVNFNGQAITGAGIVAAGTTPAQSGPLRIPWAQALTCRNSANTGDLALIAGGGSSTGGVAVDPNGVGTLMYGSLSFMLGSPGQISFLGTAGGTIGMGGQKLGFWGRTPRVVDSGWSAGAYTTTRTISASSDLATCANVLSTLVAILFSYGILA